VTGPGANSASLLSVNLKLQTAGILALVGDPRSCFEISHMDTKRHGAGRRLTNQPPIGRSTWLARNLLTLPAKEIGSIHSMHVKIV
jgi:hypothetical protein